MNTIETLSGYIRNESQEFTVAVIILVTIMGIVAMVV